MGKITTRIDPPAPGMVRLQPDFGRVHFSFMTDCAQISAQIGVEFEAIEVVAPSEMAGPMDLPASEFIKALRLLADRIERRTGAKPPDEIAAIREARRALMAGGLDLDGAALMLSDDDHKRIRNAAGDRFGVPAERLLAEARLFGISIVKASDWRPK